MQRVQYVLYNKYLEISYLLPIIYDVGVGSIPVFPFFLEFGRKSSTVIAVRVRFESAKGRGRDERSEGREGGG